MFKTNETMEIGLMRVFSSSDYYWKMVERDAGTPWFHVTIQYCAEGDVRERSFMPDDFLLVEQILSQQKEGVRVVDLQAMTPGMINKQGRWLMESLAKLELAKTAYGETVEIYTTISGSVYFCPTLKTSAVKGLRSRRLLYKRTEEKVEHPEC
ncbi:hypothetical protein [Stutzerimonas chloritidismutans]|uniref:hypothetical protein n=1 Tax=Stutzerimonas chloritidismutans TaxID=203192 RepID=UPI003F18A989